MSTNDTDTAYAKQSAYEQKRRLEKEFAAEDAEGFAIKLQDAGLKAGSHEVLQELLHWMDVLVPLGAHPTYVLQVFAGYLCRHSSGTTGAIS